MAEISTLLLAAEDFRWSYRGNGPEYKVGDWGLTATCDPFPGYAHDEQVVNETARRVSDCWAPGTDVVFVLSPLEEVGRTNGFSCRADEKRTYDDDNNLTSHTYTGYVWLSGKRIPPHPALTRYLVAHEYGHHVEWWLEQRDLGVDRGEVIREYMALRGIEHNDWSRGGHWHEAAAEIFANDFRVIVCDIESEYWPHPGVAHPNTFGPDSDVWKWWDTKLVDGELRPAAQQLTCEPHLGCASTEQLLQEVAVRMQLTQNSLKGRELGSLCLEAIANLAPNVLGRKVSDG